MHRLPIYAVPEFAKNIAKFSFFNFRFPLHDKERLEKWLKNMKRDSWVPSKYQFLCSDHFTPDSLDIRWGIRYLKQTAIPTIFSLPEDNQVLEAEHRGGGIILSRVVVAGWQVMRLREGEGKVTAGKTYLRKRKTDLCFY